MSVISFTILWSRTPKLWEPVRTHCGCPLSRGCAKRVQGGRVRVVKSRHCWATCWHFRPLCAQSGHQFSLLPQCASHKRVLAHCDKWAITHFLFAGLVRRPALNTSFMGAELNAWAGVRVNIRSAMQPSWLYCFYHRK